MIQIRKPSQRYMKHLNLFVTWDRMVKQKPLSVWVIWKVHLKVSASAFSMYCWTIYAKPNWPVKLNEALVSCVAADMRADGTQLKYTSIVECTLIFVHSFTVCLLLIKRGCACGFSFIHITKHAQYSLSLHALHIFNMNNMWILAEWYANSVYNNPMEWSLLRNRYFHLANGMK